MREYGGGSLTRRAGKWYGNVRYKDESGRWGNVQRALRDADGKTIPCGPDRNPNANIRAARAALARWRAELVAAESDPPAPDVASMPLGAYVAGWVESRAGAVAASTLRGYREYARIMAPHLGGAPVSACDARAVRAFMGSMAAHGCAPRTMLKAFNLLSMALDAAAESGAVQGNPCTTKLRRECMPRVDSPEPNALDPDGIRHALEVADAHGSPMLATAARLSLMAGLRRGECAALRWRDVDPAAGVIHVRAAIGTADGGTYEKPPKSRAGRRDVPMTPDLAAHLEHVRPACDGAGDLHVVGGLAGHVTPAAISRAWARVAGRGHPWPAVVGRTGAVASFGDLRHTFATSALRAGVDVRTLAAVMGHEDPGVTLRHYAAFMPNLAAGAVGSAADALSGRA